MGRGRPERRRVGDRHRPRGRHAERRAREPHPRAAPLLAGLRGRSAPAARGARSPRWRWSGWGTSRWTSRSWPARCRRPSEEAPDGAGPHRRDEPARRGRALARRRGHRPGGRRCRGGRGARRPLASTRCSTGCSRRSVRLRASRACAPGPRPRSSWRATSSGSRNNAAELGQRVRLPGERGDAPERRRLSALAAPSGGADRPGGVGRRPEPGGEQRECRPGQGDRESGGLHPEAEGHDGVAPIP